MSVTMTDEQRARILEAARHKAEEIRAAQQEVIAEFRAEIEPLRKQWAETFGSNGNLRKAFAADAVALAEIDSFAPKSKRGRKGSEVDPLVLAMQSLGIDEV